MITQMTISEKINALEICITKYSGTEYEQTIDLEEIKNIIENCKKLFLSGEIDKLNGLEEEAKNKYNELLDSKLNLFPEYYLEEQKVML